MEVVDFCRMVVMHKDIEYNSKVHDDEFVKTRFRVRFVPFNTWTEYTAGQIIANDWETLFNVIAGLLECTELRQLRILPKPKGAEDVENKN